MTILIPKQDYNLSTQASAGYQFFLLFNHLDPGEGEFKFIGAIIKYWIKGEFHTMLRILIKENPEIHEIFATTNFWFNSNFCIIAKIQYEHKLDPFDMAWLQVIDQGHRLWAYLLPPGGQTHTHSCPHSDCWRRTSSCGGYRGYLLMTCSPVTQRHRVNNTHSTE